MTSRHAPAVLSGSLAAASLLVVGVHAGVATADDREDGQVTVVPGDHRGQFTPPTVDLGAQHRHRSSGTDAPAAAGSSAETSSSGGGSSPCRYHRLKRSPSQMFGAYREWYGGSMGGDGQAAYRVTCAGVDRGWVTGPSTSPGSSDAQAPVLPSPETLAERAVDRLTLPLPVPRHSPDVRLADGRIATVVGEHTWLWTDRRVWRPQRERVQAGPVWAEVTARPQVLTFDSGMGVSTECAGPGTPYARAYGLHAASPDCSVRFSRSSVGMGPNDQITVTYAIRWSVSWSGSDGTGSVGGRLPEMSSRATQRWAVAEAQSLRSR